MVKVFTDKNIGGCITKVDVAFFKLKLALKEFVNLKQQCVSSREYLLTELKKKAKSEGEVNRSFTHFEAKQQLVERIGIAEKLEERMKEIEIDYLESNLSQVFSLIETKNLLSANTLIQNFLSSLPKYLNKLTSVETIRR